jgi:hypothetical protein
MKVEGEAERTKFFWDLKMNLREVIMKYIRLVVFSTSHQTPPQIERLMPLGLWGV